MEPVYQEEEYQALEIQLVVEGTEVTVQIFIDDVIIRLPSGVSQLTTSQQLAINHICQPHIERHRQEQLQRLRQRRREQPEEEEVHHHLPQ